MKYRAICDAQERFLTEGCTLEQIYGGLPYRGLGLRDAVEVAGQLNEWAMDGETYSVKEDGEI